MSGLSLLAIEVRSAARATLGLGAALGVGALWSRVLLPTTATGADTRYLLLTAAIAAVGLWAHVVRAMPKAHELRGHGTAGGVTAGLWWAAALPVSPWLAWRDRRLRHEDAADPHGNDGEDRETVAALPQELAVAVAWWLAIAALGASVTLLVAGADAGRLAAAAFCWGAVTLCASAWTASGTAADIIAFETAADMSDGHGHARLAWSVGLPLGVVVGLTAITPLAAASVWTDVSRTTWAALAVGCALVPVAVATLALDELAKDLHRFALRVRRLVHADGTEASNTPTASPPGPASGFASYEMQAAASALDAALTQIADANLARQGAIDTAQEADRVKSQFLANMSHDLRSPLNSVLGFSELLLGGIDGDIRDEHRVLIQSIHDSGRNLLFQIDDILDTAKLEAGRMEIQAEPMDPAALVHRAIENARKRRAGLRVDVRHPPRLPPALTDVYRTVQALENVLLFAAAKLEDEEVQVVLGLTHGDDGRSLFVRVRTPVAPATEHDLNLALQGFHRIPGHPGLGLGLPIAGALLELQRGSLGIESSDGGMSFTVHLPCVESESEDDVEKAEKTTSKEV